VPARDTRNFGLVTAAGAAAYPRVSVETILRAVRAGELPAADYIGRSTRISRDALNGWLATRSSAAAPAPPRPRRPVFRGFAGIIWEL
jgi:excisionase family DNA binding protein